MRWKILLWNKKELNKEERRKKTEDRRKKKEEKKAEKDKGEKGHTASRKNRIKRRSSAVIH
jgi:hypothetical protein